MLSASLIVKNEESCLEKCLQSLKGIDEIIVVDTGSSDKTCEIARKYTDKVYENEYKWNDDFAEARNYSLVRCTGDWVLTIDADEYLAEDFIEKARLEIPKAEKAGYKTINISVISTGRSDRHFQPRLYKRCKEVFWKGKIHNYISVAEDYTAKDLILYYGYSEAHKSDPDRALRILKRVVDENPKAVREKFYLAREYSYRSDWITALYWTQEYTKVQWWGPEMAENYLLMAKCLWYLQRGNEARDALWQVLKINADFKEAFEFMAEMSGPKNHKKWLEYSQYAKNEDVLFERGN
jgi:glycosyltransferase involved in cell wall biosynthesis